MERMDERAHAHVVSEGGRKAVVWQRAFFGVAERGRYLAENDTQHLI